MTSPLRVALVGCGQIADAHLQEIAKTDTGRVVAVCDAHSDLAYQAAARFAVPSQFTDLGAMLAGAKPDVVHITTPPHTHLPLALDCIEAGVHVYVEKPFTLDLREADQLIGAAARRGVQVCVGHDQLFQPVWQQCLALIRSGDLGDVVHLDCVRGYDLNGPYGALIASEPGHWIHRLPGGIFQNVMSHVVCLLTPFISASSASAHAMWFATDTRSTLPTDLRAFLRDRNVTASITMSSQARPVQRLVRVCGTRKTLEVDFESGLIRTTSASRLPGAFGRLEAPARHAGEALRNLRTTIGAFKRSEIHYFAGMQRLFTKFYEAILFGSSPPIAMRDIRETTAIMDHVFAECTAAARPLPRQGVA